MFLPLPALPAVVPDLVLNTEDTAGDFSTVMLLISASTFLSWLNLDGKLEKEGLS